MDSGHILNKKVRLLFNEFGSDGYYIWSSLIDYAYGKWGYYFDMNDPEEMELFASEYCRMKLTTVREVINGCIRRDLFSDRVAKASNILTSVMMQEAFIYATSDRRAKGSVFEIRKDLQRIEFDPVPLNIKIVPGKIEIVPVSFPQTIPRQNNTKQELMALIAPATGNFSDPGGGNTNPPGKKNAGAKKFIPPELQEVKDYFLKVIGNPRRPGHWPTDKCENEAGKFFDHYKANGWKQGRGKPIVDWPSACHNWIRNEREGAFSHTVSVSAKPPPPEQKPVLSKVEQEVNYLYETFCEDPLMITIISVDPLHYNSIKSAGLIAFSDDKVNEIAATVIKHLEDQRIKVDDQSKLKYMKKFGTLEFFKQHASQGKETVFVI